MNFKVGQASRLPLLEWVALTRADETPTLRRFTITTRGLRLKDLCLKRL